MPGAQCTDSSSARGDKRCRGLHFVGLYAPGAGKGQGVRALGAGEGLSGVGRRKGGSFMNRYTS